MSQVVAITDVRPAAKQPRTFFHEPALQALATSLKKVGQRQPITVRKRRAGARPPYEIVDGERRWRACQLAGITTIRIDVDTKDLSRHVDQHRASLVSNFLREGHTHMEISEAVRYQVDAAVEAGDSHGQAVISLAEDMGKSDTWVYQYLNLQKLDADLQTRMHPKTPDEQRLRFSEAWVLSNLPEGRQRGIYRKLLKVPLSQRLSLARSLAQETTAAPRVDKQALVKRSTALFVPRLTADIERVLDFKQSDFRAALAEIPRDQLKAFRGSIALLLQSVDRVMQS
ncbi:ParB/RepB/Spo0J family partition protein [Pseudoxanthomonas mexicana]